MQNDDPVILDIRLDCVLKVKCQLDNVILLGKHLSTYIFDIMKLKILLLLNCESPKCIASLFSLSIYCYLLHQNQNFDNRVYFNVG